VSDPRQLIRVGHSPDPDDAFMFYALAKEKIPTGDYRFEHELVDIETLNRRAFSGELELTAVSLHAYAYLTDRYLLCSCGASIGERYGPTLVARSKLSVKELSRATIAVPGTLTTAYLTLRMCLGADFQHALVPFDRILDAVAAGQLDGEPRGPGPRDVLCQHILITACAGPFDADTLYAEVKTVGAYSALTRDAFDACLDFCATGGYALRSYDQWQRLIRNPDGTWQLRDHRAAHAARHLSRPSARHRRPGSRLAPASPPDDVVGRERDRARGHHPSRRDRLPLGLRCRPPGPSDLGGDEEAGEARG